MYKRQTLDGLKENVIVGHLIPAGTGVRRYQNILVNSADELKNLEKATATEVEEVKETAASN